MSMPMARGIGTAVALALLAAACGGSGEPEDRTVTLLTHDSFSVPSEVLEAFTAETGIEIELLALGDAGQLVSQAVLTVDDPLGDVLFGIDNTFLQRGLDAELFVPYESARLGGVIEELRLDPGHRVTPIDYGDVCLNYWIDALDTEPPESLDDLLDPAHADQLVVESPETSSPGLAFLLATIATYGDGWEDYWAGLRANGVAVTSGWEDAYYGEFVAGGGSRSIVVSYATSPPAEVIFAAEPIDSPPTGVVTESCFRQVEFAGILRGTPRVGAAQRLIDFLLSPEFQESVPLSMFVFPAVEATPLPREFVDHVAPVDEPLSLDPAAIEANRDAWTERWVEIVLR
ncbi:MAG: thiamine ABC transporter substrate binding subunit [Acidimicrobiales bacterium]